MSSIKCELTSVASLDPAVTARYCGIRGLSRVLRMLAMVAPSNAVKMMGGKGKEGLSEEVHQSFKDGVLVFAYFLSRAGR